MADGTEYLIQIAAQMQGGDTSISQLTQMATKLQGAGTAANALGSALSSARAQLQAAGTASASANDALAAGQQKYNQLERAALNAAKALERAGLKTSGSAQADLAQRAAAANAALAKEASTLDRLKTSAAHAAAEEEKLGNAVKQLEQAGKAQKKLDDLAVAAAHGSGNLGKMSGALGGLGGPLGSVGQKATGIADMFSNLTETMGAAAGAVVGVIVVVVALAAAMVYAIAKTATWAVGLADVNREAALTNAALATQHKALAGLDNILPGLTKSTGQTGDELRALAVQLADAKVKAADMPAALHAAAVAEEALGKGGAAKFVADIKAGKASVSALAAGIENDLGGIAARRVEGLSGLSVILKQNLADTFGGLNLEPLLAGLKTMVGLFDQNTASGKTLKLLFEKFFQPIIDGVGDAAPVVEAFILGLDIEALKIYIAFKPIGKEIAKIFGKTDTGLPDALTVAVFLGKAFAILLADIVVNMVLLGAVLLAPVIALIDLGKAGKAAWDKVKAGTQGAAQSLQKYTYQAMAVRAWDALKAGAAGAMKYLKGIDLSSLGRSIVDGLANGIAGGAAKVIGAMKSVVGGAVSKAYELIKPGSPSKVFTALGKSTSDGYAAGVEGGTANARDAVHAMVEPPNVPPVAGGSRASGHTFQIAINAGSEAEGASIALAVEAVLLRILEGDVTQLGAAEPST